MSATFKLEDFEGPLDLLLYLIEKNKMDIYTIEIASITDQYIAYLEKTPKEALESLSEFIVMASTLLYIKSKMLLPSNPAIEEEEEDPREELIHRLLEYKKVKYVAEKLDECQMHSDNFYFRNNSANIIVDKPSIDYETLFEGITLHTLYETFQNLLQQQITQEVHTNTMKQEIVQKDIYTIEEKTIYLLNLLELHPKQSFFELFTKNTSKIEKIVTFMALLELVHKKKVALYQEYPLKDIVIIKE